MRRSWMYGVTAAGALGAVLVLRALPGQQPSSALAQQTGRGAAAGDFTDKFVAITLRGGDKTTFLQSPRFEEIQGRRFLVGAQVRTGRHFPLGDEPYHVAWDAVDAFMVFDDVKQYEESLARGFRQAQGAMNDTIHDFFSRPGARHPELDYLDPGLDTKPRRIEYPAPGAKRAAPQAPPPAPAPSGDARSADDPPRSSRTRGYLIKSE